MPLVFRHSKNCSGMTMNDLEANFARQELEWQKTRYDRLSEKYKDLEDKYFKLLTLQRTALEFKRAIEAIEGEKAHVPTI